MTFNSEYNIFSVVVENLKLLKEVFTNIRNSFQQYRLSIVLNLGLYINLCFGKKIYIFTQKQ